MLCPSLARVLAVALLCLCYLVRGSTLYTSAATGSDAGPNNCLTAATPCATIVHTLSQAVDGDSLLLNGSFNLLASVTVLKRVSIISNVYGRATIYVRGAFTGLVVRVDNVQLAGFDVVTGFVLADTVFGGAVAVINTANVLVSDLRVSMPPFSDPSEQSCVREGVGVHISGSTNVVVSGCLFERLAVCAQGGGVYVGSSSAVVVRDSVFRDGQVAETTGLGGGAFFYTGADVDVINCMFLRHDSRLRDGGAVYGASSAGVANVARFTNCTFEDNVGADGGAAFHLYGSAVYSGCTFTTNTADGSAGAVYNYFADISFVSSSFFANAAQNGGVMLALSAAAVLARDSTFTANSAQISAVFEFRATATAVDIIGSVFSRNTASESGSMVYFKDSRGAIANSTFTDHGCSSGGGVVVDGTSIASISDSIFIGNSGEVGAAVAVFSSATLTITDSRFVNNTASSTGGAIFVSQSAELFASGLYLEGNYAESTGGGIYAFGDVDVVLSDSTFASGLTNYGGGCLFVDFTSSVTVSDTSFSNCVTLTGEGGAVYLRQESTANLTRCSFTSNSGSNGGGVFATGTSRTLFDMCSFTLNVATAEGGAMYLDRDSMHTILNSSFVDNRSPAGGAIALFGQGVVDIISSNFSGHSASGAARGNPGIVTGACIFCQVSYGVRIADTRFSGNTAAALGGAIMTTSCPLNVSGSVFEDSHALTFGGAAYVNYLSRFVDTRFDRNSAAWGGGVFFLSSAEAVAPAMNVEGCTFNDNIAAGAGGAIYWESIWPAFLPSCVGCVHTGNVARGYGADEATAASYIEILVINATDAARPNSPPRSIEASRSFEVHVIIRDYFGAIYRFSDGRARRTITAEVTGESIPAGAQNSTVIGSSLVTVVDGFADFSGLFLRGSQTNLDYHLVVKTTPPSRVSKWVTFLEACETGYAKIPDPVFLFECVECPSGQFDLARRSVCSDCKKGAICEGLTRIFALRNWWWDPASSDVNPQFYQCIPDRCCPISVPGNRCLRSKPCADGWNQTSTLCSRCNEGSYEWNNKCIACEGSNRWRFTLVFVISSMLVTVLFGMGSKVGAEIRIFVFFAQAIVLIIGPVHQTMPYFGISHGRLDILSIDGKCFVRLTPLLKLVAEYSVPALLFVLLTVFSGVYLAIKFVQRRKLKAAAQGEHVPHIPLTRIINAYINLFGICTVPLLHTSFQLLICRKVGDKYLLNLAPDVECYTGEHRFWFGVGCCVASVYIFILPFGLFFYRRSVTMRILERRFWQRNLASLVNQMYKPHMFWWEIVLLTRDAVLVANYVLWFSAPERRVVAVMMIVFLFLFLHAYGMPYRDRLDNAIEMVTMVCLAYTAFLVHYPYRFQLAAVKRDQFIRDLMLFIGLASSGGFVSIRLMFDLCAPFVLPLYKIEPSALDVHHTPHV